MPILPKKEEAEEGQALLLLAAAIGPPAIRADGTSFIHFQRWACLGQTNPLVSCPPPLIQSRPCPTKQGWHEALCFNMLQHSHDVLFAVLLLVGKVAKSLFPKAGLLVSVQLADLNHLAVLLILHMIVHDLLETGTRERDGGELATLSPPAIYMPMHFRQSSETLLYLFAPTQGPTTSWANTLEIIRHPPSIWKTPPPPPPEPSSSPPTAGRPAAVRHSQLALFIEVQDTVLEVVHLTQNQSLIENAPKPPALQQGNGFIVQLLFDLQEAQSQNGIKLGVEIPVHQRGKVREQ